MTEPKKTPGSGVNHRALVLDMLLLTERGQEYASEILRGTLNKYDYLPGREKAFIKRLFEGCVERRITLDYVLDLYSATKTGKMRPAIREILRMGVYQLLYMDSVPDASVCDEAVKLAGKKGLAGLKGFVNGVLRSIAREKDTIPMPDEEKEPVRACSVRYAMPEWLVRFFYDRYGRETTHTVFGAMMQSGPVTVRMDERMDADGFLQTVDAIRAGGIGICPHPYLPYAYELMGTEGIRHVPGYEEGKFYVQDVSSMLVTEIAGLREGMTVLDVCAAPGGKSLHAAVRLRRTGLVRARDLTERKTALMEENRQRCRCDNMVVEQKDALIWDAGDEERYDVVYADLPCSGLGIMGKKCDIRHRMSIDRMEELVSLQRRILDVTVSCVKKGGVLIYSTCTVNPAENEEQVAYIVSKGFETEPIDGYLPKELSCESARKGYLQLLPGIHRTDGFFLARLRRKY